MRVTTFERAKNLIIDYFESDPQMAYTTFDIRKIFDRYRYEWRIASSKNYYQFMTFLNDSNILNKDDLKHEYSGSEKIIMRKGIASEFDIGLTIKKDGYLSNYSAMRIHQLTLQLPKTVYVSVDKYEILNESSQKELKQEAVDKAFSKKQRTSSEVYKSEYNGYRYVFVYKKFKSKGIGVESVNNYMVTDLERTLIDIAIRPIYSGGVFQIVEAYKTAMKDVDTNKIYKYLEQLDYIYPYHQLIGFLMEKSGFPGEKTEIFLKKKSHINFYQTYNMSNKKLDEKWGIYYPIGLESI